MYFWKYSSICFLWEEKIPGVHGSGQEGFGMAREAEDRSTHIVYEKDRIGEVKIADEVVAIIAGLAATEVDGVDSMAGNITNELVGKLGMKNLSKESDRNRGSRDCGSVLKYEIWLQHPGSQ